MEVKVINRSGHPLPLFKTEASARLDLPANIEDPITLQTGQRKLVGTGLFIKLPLGYEAQVRPRSGWALKEGGDRVECSGYHRRRLPR